MRRQRLEQSERDARLPEVDAARCVHGLCEQASCRACVDVCPHSAWVLDDDALGLDTEACDGCGLCAAVCPQGAIDQPLEPVCYGQGDRRVGFAVCEHAPQRRSSDGLLSCLHALSVTQLLGLRGKGVRRLWALAGDCDRCVRGQAPRLEDRLARLNALLRGRGIEPLDLERADPGRWEQARRRASDQAGTDAVSRRGLLRRALGRAMGPDLAEDDANDFLPPGSRLPRTAPGQIAFFVPTILERRCTGCDACVRICPHGAIAYSGEAGPHYRLDPERCSGCGLCRDLCAAHAVAVRAWAVPEQFRVRLSGSSCPACGTAFHIPLNSSDTPTQRLCPVCEHTGHHKKLFQVLD